MAPDVPRIGPCAPWISASDVAQQPKCDAIDEAILTSCAEIASNTLYVLSGRQFTGNCGPVTVRPVSRPVDVDTRTFSSMVPNGYLSSWGSCTAYGSAQSGAVNHFGCTRPPEIELGAYPVTEVTEVFIDGILIPPNEYQLQDRRVLVRMRPSASALPTERWGWPTCQILDLDDTQNGTFSVTYTYGVPPPEDGVQAAAYYAGQLALRRTGATSNLPQRMSSIQRSGLTIQVPDTFDFLHFGLLGMIETDTFIVTYNPTLQRHRNVVWSPDIGRPRRMPTGSS